jgi:toxin ParE1/3/4
VSLPVHIEPEARAELGEAAHWYEAARPGLGVEFTLEVDRALERIAEAASGFPIVAGADDVRRVLLERFPYALVFVVSADRATVISVAHGRRKPLYWAGRITRE